MNTVQQTSAVKQQKVKSLPDDDSGRVPISGGLYGFLNKIKSTLLGNSNGALPRLALRMLAQQAVLSVVLKRCKRLRREPLKQQMY